MMAVCNQKGGVGKTTTVVNLGVYLAMAGRRVLLVDFDPQGNASSGLGFQRSDAALSVYEGVLGSAKHASLVSKTEITRFSYIPAHPNLAGLTIELLDKPRREYYLHDFLAPLRNDYDYILIDLPPSVSLLTVNGLVAADEVLIPVQCEYYGLEGLGQLLQTIDLINNNLKRDLKIAGALITMYDAREHLSREVSKEVRRHFSGHVYDVEIPRSIALAEAPSFGKPIALYAPDVPGARAYERLAREVIAQEKRASSAVPHPVLSPRPQLAQATTRMADIRPAATEPRVAPANDTPKILFEYQE